MTKGNHVFHCNGKVYSFAAIRSAVLFPSRVRWLGVAKLRVGRLDRRFVAARPHCDSFLLGELCQAQSSC